MIDPESLHVVKGLRVEVESLREAYNAEKEKREHLEKLLEDMSAERTEDEGAELNRVASEWFCIERIDSPYQHCINSDGRSRWRRRAKDDDENPPPWNVGNPPNYKEKPVDDESWTKTGRDVSIKPSKPSLLRRIVTAVKGRSEGVK